MTDAYTASQFAAPSTPTVSEFDTSSIDRNLRQIKAVEQTWRLPAVPDNVRLDLASMPGANEDSLLDLLTGLDSDLNDDDEEPSSGLILPNSLRPSGLDQAQIILAGISSNPPPQEVSANSVSIWKQRAMQKGYLSEDTPIDEKWAPELNRIRSEMAYDDYNRALRGNRALAMPIGDDENGFMRLLNDFTSPSGLLAAATELDLWFDTGAIKSEISSWGDKWREVGKSKNPWDFAGNLVDALTGPIDDIVFPILNIGLMFTGIGAVANSARVGWNGARLAEAGGLFGRLYGAAGTARNLTEIGRTSMLGERLLRSDTALRYLGRGMEAWRGWTPTKAVKSVVQQGMRLGFAQELESRVGGYKGQGASLTDLSPGIQGAHDFLEQAKMAPLAMPFEVLLAPYNIFTPGSFVRQGGEGLGLLSRAGSGAFRALGTTGGRAAAGAAAGVVAGTVAGNDAGDIGEGALLGAGVGAALPAVGRLLSHAPVASAVKGAIAGAVAGEWLGDGPEDVALGALAGAGMAVVSDSVRAKMFDQLGLSSWNKRLMGLGQAMVKTSFIPLADDHRISYAFDQGMREALRGDPERLAKWTSDVDSGGVRGALRTMQGGDEELAAATVGYVYTSSMIDWIATAQADVLGKKGWRGRYHSARNKLINQLRQFDTTDLTEGRLNEIALSAAFTREGSDSLAAVYKRRDIILREMKESPEKALEWANKQNEMAAETVRQLTSQANFPKIDTSAAFEGPLPTPDRVGMSLGESFAGQDLEGRGWIMQKYMGQIADTFGDYPKFASATAQIREARLGNLFDGAKLRPYKSRFGSEKSIYRSVAKTMPEEQAAINSAVTDQLLKLDAKAIGNVKGASPLAAPNNPAAVTVGRATGKWKQDLEELAEQIRDIRDVRTHLSKVRNRGEWTRQAARGLGVDETTKLTDLTAKQIHALLDPASGFDFNLGSKAATEYIVGYAKRNGLSLGELDQALAHAADELANDAAKWQEYGFDAIAYGDDGRGLYGMDALDARLKEVQQEIPFRAAEIDAADLVRYLRDAGDEAGAAQMETLVKGLEGDGYKLVHGVEFLMPEDLAHGPIFEDVTRRHLNAASLGNAFRGKLPVERLLLEERRQRLAITQALAKLRPELSPEDPEVTKIIRSLNDLLHEQQEPLNSALRNYHMTPAAERATVRLKSITTPVRLDDLSRRKDLVIDHLSNKLGLSADEAKAVWGATHKFRSTDWSEVGAYALEAKMRSTNVAEWGLKTLTGSKYGSGFKAKLGGVGTAAVVGATYGAVQTMDQEGLSWEDRLKAAATGAVLGVGGLAAARVGSSLVDKAFTLKGGASLVDRAAHWRYGYLPDHLAQVRDSLRFTLSPMFDLSRYTEGLFLAQTAAPLRNPDGSRMALNLNLTPHGLRRALRKEGMTAEAAQQQYQKWVHDFSNWGRRKGDFDAEVLDSTGRWFKQLGILGFSPVDWMGTAYAQMVRSGLTPEKAYDAAREMYTYGVRGRSAAEMTANFVFFPFSFQKKALGHMAKWMNDDLSRSIIIHDALQTYSLLDEKYNLDERWRDHAPFLQQLSRLNLFAFGLSPGRFGGINSQLFESMGKLGWNAFVPVGLDIKDATAAGEIQDVMHNLTPVLNDINWMTKNIQETGEVVDGMWDGSYLSRSAEIRKGYDEWSTFKQGFEGELSRRGYSLNDVFDKPWLAELRALYESQRAELSDKYPEWFEFRSTNVGEIQTLQKERQLRLDRVKRAQVEGRPPKPDDFMVAQMEDTIDRIKADLQLRTGSSDLTNAPTEIVLGIRQQAEAMVRQNPSFRRLWDQFFSYELGPLSFTQEL